MSPAENSSRPQGESQRPLGDNPPGYVPPGQGLEDLAGADHAFKKAAHRMEEIEQRASDARKSGGFQMDPETMRDLQQEWENIARKLGLLRAKARRLGYAEPPAEDPASVHQVEDGVRPHAKICAQIHEEMYIYAEQYALSMDKAIKKVEEADQAAQEVMRDRRDEL